MSAAARMARMLATLGSAALLATPAGPPRAPGAPARVAHGPARASSGPAHAPGGPARASDGPARAPSGPPLVQPGLTSAYLPGSGEASASAAPSGGDVLAANGLSSPLCRTPHVLSEAARQSCQTSRFSASPDPTGDYAFDVNIDTGIGQMSNDVSAIVQDFAQQAWMALVAVTHALIVMFEWCYSLNLLSKGAMAQATHALHAAGLAFTEPWMAFALAVVSALAAYHGLVRRRIAQSVSQALTTLAMMLAALWLIADPAGTIGSLQRWADEGAGSALAVTFGGQVSHRQATLATGMADLFGAVVTAPWCYLEFGDVGWCEDRARLDPRLRMAALAIARRLPARTGCPPRCSGKAGAEAASASLLRSAQTNGQLFLALPANEPLRNSSKEARTLLNVLCGGGPPADRCQGPTAAQAEFRSERGTDSRLMGLAPIWLGALGMLLCFGLLAVRLLLAAVTTVLYLLLAPAVALVAALGDTGRSLFRSWSMRLLSACVSKLAYSFVLGVLLTITHMLLSLTALGWGAQWCLVSAFWWTAFAKRHHAFELLGGERRTHVRVRYRSSGWRAFDALVISRIVTRLARSTVHLFGRPPEPRHQQLPPGGRLRRGA